MRRLLLLLFLAASLVLAACAGGPDPRAGSAASGGTTLTAWTQYHHGPGRAGHLAHHPTGRLARAWTKATTGQVYGEPLVIGDTLVVATERNYVYGLNARSGATRWRVQLGPPQPQSELPCGNIDPLGITSTPAYDGTTKSVFVVAETRGGTHTLWALGVGAGHRKWHRTLDTQADRSKLAEQQRSALLVTQGRVLTAFGGLAGDCSNYVGYVTSVPVSGRGATTSYAVPTAREAGMWATPGPIRGRNGMVYVASGNGAELNGTWDKSDSVTELRPGTLQRLSVFAPSTWRDDNVKDLDLGSSSPAMVSAVDRLVIAGKRGVAYLLRPTLGGVGSAVTSRAGCHAFGGSAVVGARVLMACRDEYAVRVLRVGRSSLSWGWRRNGVYGSPVVAGDRVYVADQRSGDLVVLSLSNGKVLSRHHAGPMPHFPSEAVSGDWVFVPTLNGVTAFRGR